MTTLRDELAEQLQWKVPNRREHELANELLPWLERKLAEARDKGAETALTSVCPINPADWKKQLDDAKAEERAAAVEACIDMCQKYLEEGEPGTTEWRAVGEAAGELKERIRNLSPLPARVMELRARLEEAKWWRHLVIMDDHSYFAVEGDKRIASLERDLAQAEAAAQGAQ